MTAYTANVQTDILKVGDRLVSPFTQTWGEITAIVPYKPQTDYRKGWRVAVFEGGQSMTLTPGTTTLPGNGPLNQTARVPHVLAENV